MTAQPDLEGLLKQFADGGWETLAGAADLTAGEQRKRESRMREISADILWMASTPGGKRILGWLLNHTLRKATWHGDLRIPLDQAANYGLYREGQNSVAAMFLQAIAYGTGGDLSILTQPAGEPHEKIVRLSVFIRAGRWLRRWRRGGRRRR